MVVTRSTALLLTMVLLLKFQCHLLSQTSVGYLGCRQETLCNFHCLAKLALDKVLLWLRSFRMFRSYFPPLGKPVIPEGLRVELALVKGISCCTLLLPLEGKSDKLNKLMDVVGQSWRKVFGFQKGYRNSLFPGLI